MIGCWFVGVMADCFFGSVVLWLFGWFRVLVRLNVGSLYFSLRVLLLGSLCPYGVILIASHPESTPYLEPRTLYNTER